MPKIIFGQASVIKAKAILEAHRVIEDPVEVRALFTEKWGEKLFTDASIDDYPRAELTAASIRRVDDWVEQWVKQHGHLEYNGTGRECQALGRKLAADLMVYLEFSPNNMQVITGTIGGRGHEVTLLRGPGEWVYYDAQRGRLPRAHIGLKTLML